MTHDVEHSVHKGQNSWDNNLCKSDVQVGIYLKLLLIKLNPAVFFSLQKLLSLEEILVSCYFFLIISSLKGHSCLRYIRCFAQIGMTSKILKMWKTPIVKLQAYFAKSNTPPWVLLTFLKLYKWYQTKLCKTSYEN